MVIGEKEVDSDPKTISKEHFRQNLLIDLECDESNNTHLISNQTPRRRHEAHIVVEELATVSWGLQAWRQSTQPPSPDVYIEPSRFEFAKEKGRCVGGGKVYGLEGIQLI